jgi:hypothetical protein
MNHTKALTKRNKYISEWVDSHLLKPAYNPMTFNFDIPAIPDIDKEPEYDLEVHNLVDKRHGIYISLEFYPHFHLPLAEIKKIFKEMFQMESIYALCSSQRSVLKVLDINPSKMILHFRKLNLLIGGYVARAVTDNRKRAMIRIEIDKSVESQRESIEYVLWHESMHIKDCLERRFPSIHEMAGINFPGMEELWHFSIDGRLEKLGLPHGMKEDRIEELMVYTISKKKAQQIANALWGKEVTLDEIILIGEKLGFDYSVIKPFLSTKKER